jgi:hypothetical protein
MARVVTGWSEFDWLDLIPAPGAFVSPTYADYNVHGTPVRALNWLHAKHQWLKGQLEQNGEEWGRCAHCNQPIRYAVIFLDPETRYHIVGENCAEFINSNLNRAQWAEQRRLSEIKKVKTKNGERYTLSLDVPDWFWRLPKEERPAYTSLFKWEGPRRKVCWYLTIWGETACEVLLNWEALQKLKP